MSCVLTLALNGEAQSHFEALRLQHFPAALNRVPAHLSLFHTLPDTAETVAVLREIAADTKPISIAVEHVRSIGRGVAYFMHSPELSAVHRRLSAAFAEHLSPQDRQGFRPHVVVQNKVDPAHARETLALLQAGFRTFTVQGIGLDLWQYLGGPWELKERVSFST